MSASECFFDLPVECYNTLLDYLPDSAVGSLLTTARRSHKEAGGIMKSNAYWLGRIALRTGVPEEKLIIYRAIAKALYKDIARIKDSDLNLVIDFLDDTCTVEQMARFAICCYRYDAWVVFDLLKSHPHGGEVMHVANLMLAGTYY